MKALNYNKDKPRWSLLLKDMSFSLAEMLKVRENGAKKYDRMNFIQSKGTEDAKEFLDDNLDSIYRHLAEAGDVDEESKCYHMAHVAIRAMFALEYLQEAPERMVGMVNDKNYVEAQRMKNVLYSKAIDKLQGIKSTGGYVEDYSPIREFDES